MKFSITCGKNLVLQKEVNGSLNSIHTSNELLIQADKTSHVFNSQDSNKIIICPLTTHIPLKKVANVLSNSKLIYQKIILINIGGL